MTPSQNETLRHATLEALAIRHPSALNVAQIIRAIKKEVAEPFTEQDINSALEFLRSSNFAASSFDGMGSTQYWSATSHGVLYFERNLK